MSEDERNESRAAPQAGGEEGAEVAGDSVLRQFLGLFVVPLLVVLLCVAVFIGFGWIAYERQSIGDLLNDLNDSRPLFNQRRKMAAYELSKIMLADPDAVRRDPAALAEVRRLFREVEEPEVRQYLALVLGRSGEPEDLSLLLDALDDADSQTRIYALWALGALGDAQALPALTAALADPDPGIRKTAAYALGQIGAPEAVPALVPRLDDATADVRWNTALALARLGSDAGVPVLERMLDRRLLAQVPEITAEQQEEVMVSAAEALAVTRGQAARPLLERLAEDDPSLKVRRAAHRALEVLEERRAGG